MNAGPHTDSKVNFIAFEEDEEVFAPEMKDYTQADYLEEAFKKPSTWTPENSKTEATEEKIDIPEILMIDLVRNFKFIHSIFLIFYGIFILFKTNACIIYLQGAQLFSHL